MQTCQNFVNEVDSIPSINRDPGRNNNDPGSDEDSTNPKDPSPGSKNHREFNDFSVLRLTCLKKASNFYPLKTKIIEYIPKMYLGMNFLDF